MRGKQARPAGGDPMIKNSFERLLEGGFEEGRVPVLVLFCGEVIIRTV